jgi:GT2 family glycosyltransferase
VSQVDLVIPTYNGRGHLRTCLQAIRAQTFTDTHVIVVDDGSTDGTDRMMANEFPEFSYVPLAGNQGFAAACNAGIGTGSAELVALLNNDAIPEPEWLRYLVDAIKRSPEAGALASKILLADGSGRFHAAGDTFFWTGLPNSRGVWEVDEGQYDVEKEVFSTCAAAALYRRSALEQARLITGDIFEPNFFMYLEDIDLGWRLRLLGFSIVYVPEARVFHHLSATGGGSLASYFVARNRFAVLVRNLPQELKRTVWPRFAVQQVRQMITALAHLREPAARARIRGILAGLWFARTQRRKRRAIQSARRVELKRISKMLT